MNNYSDKNENDLQGEIDGAFRYTEGNAAGATTQILKILLVIAERNKREFIKLEKKNRLYTWIIIGLAVITFFASVVQIWIALSK